MQPWHVFGGSINAPWQRRIGGQKPREKGRGLRAGGDYEGRMTELRVLAAPYDRHVRRDNL